MELKRLLKSRSCRKVLQFFHENPASIDTARGVATWTNQDTGKVREALEELARHNLLIAHKASSTTGYSFTKNEKVIEMIDRLLRK